MTTFSIETKLLILSRIAKKTIWWRRFFESIQYDSMKKLHIRCDNRQILCVLKKEMLKLDTKLKHVDIHKHWLTQEIQTNQINVSWCSTAEMSADDFIKVLSRQKHEKFLRQLHLIDITHLINQKKRSIWTSRCQTERVCWKKSNRWSDIMISWDDEMSWWDNESRTIRKINLFEKDQKIRWFDHLIWSIDIWFITSSFNSLCMNDLITNRICLFETIRIVNFFINMLTSNRVVLRSFSRDDLYKSRWFLSYLLIFEIVEKSKNSKMSMRFWWNQIEVTTKLEDILIRRKESRDDRRSRFSERSRWIMRWEINRWDCRKRTSI
jgi:hypothetical protein